VSFRHFQDSLGSCLVQERRTKFHPNRSGIEVAVTSGRIDGRTDMMKFISHAAESEARY